MTHEQIEATIERLKSMDDSPYNGKYESGHILIEFMHSALSTNAEFRDRLIDLLEQADPDTHIELPRDADGVPIHVGDELISNHSKKKFVVTRLKYSRKHAWMIGGANKDDLSEYGLYAPCETRRYLPTVEDVLREFGDEVQRCCDTEDTIAEYAAKLREVMADDDAR